MLRYVELTKEDHILFDKQVEEFNKLSVSPHNLIFLDVDGVLNFDKCKERTPEGYIGIANSRVKILAEIVKNNDACIVLSSSWKSYWQLFYPENEEMDADGLYLIRKLSEEGVALADKTVDHGYDRGLGIHQYLESHPHKGWLVLDDEIFVGYREYKVMQHLIKTSFRPNGGLKEKYIKKAEKIFALQEE